MYKAAFLMLGDECNFHCKYCIQTGCLDLSKTRKLTVSPKVYDFLLTHARQLAEQGEMFHIQLWGGEPLVYWDTLREVVETLYPTGLFSFGIISNGSLLTRDKVDFINKYPIPFALSHDGENTEYTRGRDVLKEDNIRELFRQLKDGAILAVISAQNPSPQKTRQYFEQTYGITNVNFDNLLETMDMPEDIYNINVEEYCKAVDEIMNNFYDGVLTNTRTWEAAFCQAKINRIKAGVNNHADEMFNYPPCKNIYQVANLGIDGTIYLCHNNSVKLGTIADSQEELLNRFEKYNTRATSERCRKCPYFFACGGGCILVPDGEKFERFCIMQKLFLSRLYGTLLKFNKEG